MANTFPSSGFVGIGTASPNYLLDIPSNNNLYLSNLYITGCSLNPILSSGGTGGSMCLQGGGAGEGAIRLQGASANTNGHISFLTNQVEAMRINTGGNVGIGMCTPCGALDVYKPSSGGSGTGDNLIVRGGNSATLFGSNQIRFGFAGGIGYSHAIKSRHQSGSPGNNALDFFIWTTADAAETTGTKLVMTLDGTGNVGIGTCSPTNTLDVVGDTSLRGDIIFNKGSRTTIYPSATNQNLHMKSNGCGLLQFNNDNTGNVSIATGGGKLGIGTDSPSTKLAVEGSGTDIENVARFNNQVNCTTRVWLRNSNHSAYWGVSSTTTADTLATGMIAGAMTMGLGNNYPIQFWNGSTATVKMTIDNCGAVGINTTTPGSYKLYVNGTFYAAGSSQDYKQSICNYNTDSCMFMKLKPVTYQYKDEWCHLGKELKSETQIGLIAEDVAEVYPELAILVNEDDQKIVRNVDYEKLSIVLLSEVQKLRKELDELKTK